MTHNEVTLNEIECYKVELSNPLVDPITVYAITNDVDKIAPYFAVLCWKVESCKLYRNYFPPFIDVKIIDIP